MKLGIINGLVVDPHNNTEEKLNIIIENGKIMKLTKDNIKCDEVIDADNCVVCPGFIDIHMHEDRYDEEKEEFEQSISMTMLNMGVTSCIGGNCGINTNDPKMYLDKVDERKMPVNIGLMAGYTDIREKISNKNKYEHIDQDSIEKLKLHIKQYLDAGCFGISYGIRYVPGIDNRELEEISSLCVESKKLITAHVRDDADYVFEATKEIVDIGKKLNIPVQNSHIGSMAGFGQMKELLNYLDIEADNGLEITSDCYPYSAFSTKIGETTYDDGFLERYNCDYSSIEICEGKYKGMRCTKEIFEDLRKNYPQTITVAHVMKSDEIELALTNKRVMLASDGLLNNNQGHPRAAGTFPRFIHKYVKENKISLFDAINKMTTMQAKKLGLKNKGNLSIGSDADIVIFNFNDIEDTATFTQPVKKPMGIEHVIISGEFAIKNREVINTRLGKALRK